MPKEYRFTRSGSTLFHEIVINPTNSEINEFFRQFRKDLKLSLSIGDIEKKANKYHLLASDCGIYLPEKRWFTLQDITYSKSIFKKFKHKFYSLNDWNDLNRFIQLVKKLRIKKPVLTAHLIFSAWKHDNVNLDDPREIAVIYLKTGQYIIQDKYSKLYIKRFSRGKFHFSKNKNDAKKWAKDQSAWNWFYLNKSKEKD